MQIVPLFKQGARSGISFGLEGLLQRWQSALLECFPVTARKLFIKEQARMVLELSGDGAAARLEKGDEIRPIEAPVRNRPDELKALPNQADRVEVALTLLVPRADVLLKKVYLPAQVKDNLPRVLSYEIDRLTPFQAEDIYFDFRLLPSRVEAQLLVELACLKRERVAAWLQGLDAAGRSPTSMQWPGAWAGANLLPAAVRRPNRGGRVLSWVLWILVLTLTAAALVTPLLQKREVVTELGEQVAAARSEANQVAELRRQLEQAAEAANFLGQKKREALRESVLLSKLSELIPDHTWVNQLNLSGANKVDIRGESEHATELIEILSRDPSFRKITFKSPVVGIRNTDRERFHIEFRFVAGDGSG